MRRQAGTIRRPLAKYGAFALLFASARPAAAAARYLDCAVATSGTGVDWAHAWKNLSDVTGLVAGDIVYISGSAACSTYSGNWPALNGTRDSPIIYRAAQPTDIGHTSPVTITGGNPGMAGVGGLIRGLYIDGNYNGARHITMRGLLGAAGTPTHWDGVRLSYITMDATQIEGGIFEYTELDHDYVDLPHNYDHFWKRNSVNGGATGYTVNLIHDNVIRTREATNGSGFGDDGFQWIGNSSIYNNAFIAVFDPAQTIQHLDFIQTCDQYLAIYDNYFENPGNYSIYGDCFGGTAHWRIYNNVFTETGGHGQIALQQIGIGFEGNYGASLDDFVVANNTCSDATSGHSCIRIAPGDNGSSNNIINSYVVNNLCYNSGIDLVPGPGSSITKSNNYEGTTNVDFVNAGPYPTGDWHLQAGSTNAINQGISPAYLTSVYTTDKDGSARSSPWDLGAYEFGSSAPPSPPTGLTATVL